ncbi:tetraacyldisaccharide 4'-kinase [Martelella lutilitoris]|uniref:Tetraacyldisaccharide 4'-kinase n=1 Tax=Martelella lutilitoris TaxID=2583532 RepID=A0A5C4JQQ1_9HYPH|nr:tetraacyldisaccharide 4'-kinase [Martelella lutilitoris]TNB47551.1 tetraacyldisaccharide 4'-kinase [Martelella lutilitoris]
MQTTIHAFWWRKSHVLSRILWPFARLYGAIAGRRMRRAKGATVSVPVLCVGNFTVGGTGKTPVAEALAKAAIAAGRRPGFVLRGYGAKVASARLVDPAKHTHADVGDEALMLSRTAPVAVSPARVDAAELLVSEGVDFIIMDDGLQSGRLRPDFAVAVVDAKRGFGNGLCLPAGPLRAPLAAQLPKTNVILLNGDGACAADVTALARQAHMPMERFSQTPDGDGAAKLAGRRVLAYAGIGDPDKFFDTLEGLGAVVAERVRLADHEAITPALARKLLAQTGDGALLPVTTAKDMARLSGATDRDLAALRALSAVLEITAVFEDPMMADCLVSAAADAFKRRGDAPD